LETLHRLPQNRTRQLSCPIFFSVRWLAISPTLQRLRPLKNPRPFRPLLIQRNRPRYLVMLPKRFLLPLPLRLEIPRLRQPLLHETLSCWNRLIFLRASGERAAEWFLPPNWWSVGSK
jgi:hypothetical protein